MTPALSVSSKTPLPFREGLLQIDPPALLGSVCLECSTRLFPARTFCPACNGDAVKTGVALADRGKVYSFTVVHQAPPGRATPYSLAYVDLDDGVRVMTQIDAPLDDLKIGMSVRLDIREVGEKDGYSLVGYVFIADFSEGGAR